MSLSPISPIIKVCGMRDAQNIREVESIGIDLMGFIFWPRSSRYVCERPAYLPKCKRVGVYVNEDVEQVKRTASDYALTLIQLHGNESPEYVRQLRKWEVIKAFNIASTDDLEQTKAYEGLADYFLFDTKGKSVGGNGEKFDWNVLEDYHGDTPFLLSGGIGPEDAEFLKHWHHPKCIGFDINSRFEQEPGIKDINKIKTFINTIRHHE